MARVPRTPGAASRPAPEGHTPEASGSAAPSARWAISLSIILGCLTHSIMMGSVNIALPAMMTSLLVYLAASMLCGLSWDLKAMICFRVLQGEHTGCSHSH